MLYILHNVCFYSPITTTTKLFFAENDDCGRGLCERRDVFWVRRQMNCRAERAKFEIHQETLKVQSERVCQRCSSKI